MGEARVARARWAAAAAGAFLAQLGPAHASDFERDVRPILQQHCVACHGREKQESLLRLDSRRPRRSKGGMSGDAIVPGRSRDSLLVRHLRGEVTPADAEQEAAARRRRRSRASRRGSTPGRRERTRRRSRRTSRGRPHWAYVKPRAAGGADRVATASWVRNPIDAFVLARLEREGLAPSPEAVRETLIRRLSLDLVGLPPDARRRSDAFLADTSPDAYERLVDRLLASPHYGERWARPWLDLARYADTNGYEKDQRRTAWKYRDWVIDALNRDLSFHDFTIEQIAGDMLPGRERPSSGSPPASTATRSSTRRAGSTSRRCASRRSSTA